MDDVLVGSGRRGDYVHANQTMASKEGFKCVSRLWWEKTQPMSEGIDAIYKQSQAREDIVAGADEFSPRINGVGELVLEHVDGREFRPTDHAWNHILYWSGRTPQTFWNFMQSAPENNGKKLYSRDANDTEVMLVVLKNGWRRVNAGRKQGAKFLFRTYKDGTLRAMLSDIYGIINNVWYLETIQALFKEIGGEEPRLSHWRGDADTIYGNILIPDTCREDSDSDYGGMISVSNCEIGKRALSQYPSIFRAICMNGCIWDHNKGYQINRRHRGEINYKELGEAIVANIHRQIPLMSEAVNRFLATKSFVMSAPPVNVLVAAGAQYKLTPKQMLGLVEEYGEFEADNRNLFGLINSFTRAGQKLDNKEWVRFDEIAGDLMNYKPNAWERLNSTALTYTKEEVTSLLGAAV